MKTKSLFLVAVALFAFGANAATKYVKPHTGSTAWEGKSDVYSTIAGAVSAAQAGDEVWVAQGDYVISAALPWKSGVNVYGGFVGNETDKEQRSRDALLTAITNSGATFRLLAATAALATPTTWSGFTFQSSGGGGVQMHASCILDNCVVRNNTWGGVGGGILADVGATTAMPADVAIQSCRIVNNQANGSNAGGGIYVRASKTSAGKLILKNSVIANNRGGNNGGGMVVSGLPSEITYCTFAKNTRNAGGWPGGATYLNETKTTIANCIFWGNEDTYTQPHPDIYMQPAAAGSSIKNCIVSREITQGNGAGQNEYDIIDQSGDNSHVTVKSITVLTNPTTNDELKFTSPSATVGYNATAADIYSADWSIQSGSAAVDSGVAIAGLTTDITGRARPKLTGVDVGAYEYVEHINIQATENSTTTYNPATMGDVTIYATDAGTGQWRAANASVTDGVIKVVKAVEANKVYAVGFPFAVSSISKPFATLESYNGLTNLFEKAFSVEAGRGYLISFATAGDVTFTSAPNPTLLTAYPEASATYKLAPALSLKNEAGIGSAAKKYYSYSAANATWSNAADGVAGGALKPFDAVIASTAAGSYYDSIGKGLPTLRWANVVIDGGRVTITKPRSGASPYVMGVLGGKFDLKFKVSEGYVPDTVTTKTGKNPEVSYALGGPVGGEYTVTVDPITDSVTIAITTKKQELNVTVSMPVGVTVTAPAAGTSPYAVLYDSTFVLEFTVNDNENYLPLVSINGAATFIPPVEEGVYVVTRSRVKVNQTIAVSLVKKRTVTLKIDPSVAAGVVTITKPAGGAGAYPLPEGKTFTYAFTARNGYSVLVNGDAKTAGEDHSVAMVSKDTTLTITVKPATWKVTLNADGALSDIILTNAYPNNGYDVTHEQPLSISFTVTNGKYPKVAPPKGVAYLLTKTSNMYTLTLPYVGDSLNVGLTAQEGVVLPKGVVPVAEDVSSRGVSFAAKTSPIFVSNKGAYNGNTYATHLKFDFSHLSLSTLQTFSSVQLKLNTAWQANDAKGAQWLVTETADTWSENSPFLMNASPAPVDTIGTFTFGDIHPASPAANVDIYINLTDYLKAWLSAPERSTDKTLSLRIFNTLQSNNGGEVDLKSKETAGDVGPKLVFGSLNTAVSSLTVGGAAVTLKPGVFDYVHPLELSAIGKKMPLLTYTPAEASSSHVLASPVAYTPADTVVAQWKRNAATFTVAPVDGLKEDGAKHTYTVTFKLPPVPLEIGATEAKLPGSYTNDHSDIIFHVTDASAAQLINRDTLPVRGVVKVVRTFEANRFYAVGFPFGVTPSVAPKELFSYDGAQLQPAAQIEKDKGYLIKFDKAGEVTFTSTANPTLRAATSTIAQGDTTYKLTANPQVNNLLYATSNGFGMKGFYYRYNSVGHYFEKMITNSAILTPVKTFDGIIVSSNESKQYITLGADSKLPHSVTYTASSGIVVTSGQKPTTAVQQDSAYVLTFTVGSCHQNPVATLANNPAYTLGAPDANGVYTVKIGAVTQDTVISISASVRTFGVTIAKSNNVTLTEGKDTALSCGTPYTVKFTVAVGAIAPEVAVNGALVRLNAPDSSGKYAVTVTVDTVTAISITAPLKRFGITVTSDGNVTPSIATGVTHDAPYGSAFTFTFTLNAHYANPQVTVGGAPYALGAPGAQGVYTVTIGAVTHDTAVSITASLATFGVSIAATNVTLISPTSLDTTMVYGSPLALAFTVNEHYENPQVAVNGAGVRVTLADTVAGIYAAGLTVDGAAAVSVTASPRAYNLILTAGANVALVQPAAAGAIPAPYGSPFVVSFTVAAGYTPTVKTDGVEVAVGNPDAAGVYTVTAAPQVAGEHLVAITAAKTATAIFKEDLSDPVVRVQYYTVAGVELSQPAITGLYIVKRTLASKKVVVRKELVIVR
jgi:hypothetical protein